MAELSNDEIAELLQHGYRYALSLVQQPSAAEDLLQTAWLSILKAKAEFSKPYLFTTLRNQFINQYRRESLVPMISLDTDVLQETTQNDYYEDTHFSIDFTTLERALSCLRPVEREIIFLAYVEEYTAMEIADHMNLARGTVLSLMHRTKQKLRNHLQQQAGEVSQ